jgi:hypothetical protein
MKKLLPFLVLFICASCNNQGSTTEKDNVIQSQEQKIKELEERLNKMEEPNKSGVRDSVDYSQIYISPQETKKEYYSIGSTESEVLNIQGEPSSINDFGSGKLFMYGASIITFRNGKVVSYSNLDNNLKIRVSSKTLTENNSTAQTATPKGKTKYVYFYCFVRELDIEIYYSKIFKINDYNEDKLYEIKNCLVEKVKFFKQQSGKIEMFEYLFDSFSAASVQWNAQTGKKIFGDDSCGL